MQTSVGELLDLVDELEVFLHGNGSRMINEVRGMFEREREGGFHRCCD